MKLQELSIADLFALRNYYNDIICEKEDEEISNAVDAELLKRLNKIEVKTSNTKEISKPKETTTYENLTADVFQLGTYFGRITKVKLVVGGTQRYYPHPLPQPQSILVEFSCDLSSWFFNKLNTDLIYLFKIKLPSGQDFCSGDFYIDRSENDRLYFNLSGRLTLNNGYNDSIPSYKELPKS